MPEGTPSHGWRFGLLLMLLTPLGVGAQGGPPMLTDDPGTPGAGKWEINTALLAEHSDHSTEYALPLLDINYGVGERIQLKFEVPWLVETTSGSGTRSGLGNGMAGIKWRFFDAGDNGWKMSMYPQVESSHFAPTSWHHGLTDSGTSVLLPLQFQHALEAVDIGFDVGRWVRPAAQSDSWIGGVVIGHEVRKGLEFMAELHDEAALGFGSDALTLNFGTRWVLADCCTLLASAGTDLHNGLEDKRTFRSYLGVQVVH